jgi:hypothetical protein
LNVVLLPWRVREHSGGQKMHTMSNNRASWVTVRSARADKATAMENGLKGHFRRYRDSIFKKIFVRLVNIIKSFDSGHIQKCPFWSMPLHFRNASAASVYGNMKGCFAWISQFSRTDIPSRE